MVFEAVIGLEIHVQLNCPTKLFCDCPNSPGDDPNQNICPVCLWLPGALPKFSHNALEKATLACLALNCDLQPRSAFDQKVYYYPDLPKGYQLSQAHRPLAKNGWVTITGEDGQPKKLALHHIHMEEDVAKLVHETEGRTPVSLVDFNRAGTPLIEIVTEPVMHSPYEAMEFLRTIRKQIRYSGSSDCSMEQGSMRVDANISIRPAGTDQLNTKVEVKNMNSIHNVGNAIAYEIKRQTACVKSKEPVILHTRLWDPDKKITTAMRGKFEGPCVPDPSVPEIVITENWLRQMQDQLPEMPAHKTQRFISTYGLNHADAALMSSEKELAEYFEALVQLNIPAENAVHSITTHLLPMLKERGLAIDESPVTAERFSRLIAMVQSEAINTGSARQVLGLLFDSDQTPEQIVEQSGFSQISDSDELETIVAQVMADHPDAVDNFRAGNSKSIGFLIGQAMRASGGKANPKILKELFNSKLNG